MDISSLKDLINPDFIQGSALSLILSAGLGTIVILLVLLKVAYISMHKIDQEKTRPADLNTEK